MEFEPIFSIECINQILENIRVELEVAHGQLTMVEFQISLKEKLYLLSHEDKAKALSENKSYLLALKRYRDSKKDSDEARMAFQNFLNTPRKSS